MAHVSRTAGRWRRAAALVIAAAPAAVALLAGPGADAGVSPLAACPAGEIEDGYTFACVPEIAPRTGGPLGAPAVGGTPSEQGLIACNVVDRAECLERELYPTPVVPGPGAAAAQRP